VTAPLSEVSEDQLALNPFDTMANRPEVFLTAGLIGRLSSNGQCVILGTSRGAITLLWPEGTQLRREGGRTLIVLPDNRGVGVYGSEVRLGGGVFQESERGLWSKTVRQNCPERAFAVSTIAK
jgi:hypothetical protein